MIVSIIFIVLGLVVIVSGVVGLFKFPDFYTKLHAAGIIDSCGIPLCLIGLAISQDSGIASLKILLIALLIFILSPLSTYAISKIALALGVVAKRNQDIS